MKTSRKSVRKPTMRQAASALVLLVVVASTLGMGLHLARQSHAATLVKVMPLGDSITDGLAYSGAYRRYLWQRLVTEEGYNFDFVGSLSNGTADLGDKNHEGHSGWRIRDLRANIDGWMATYQPNIVLLLIGSNDAEQDDDMANAPARLLDLVNRMCTDRPGIEVVVSSATPERGESVDIPAFNAKVPGVVSSAKASGCNAVYVDGFSALTLADLDDGIHPNWTGHSKLANVFYPPLKAFLAGVPTDTVKPTAMLTAPAANASLSGTVTLSANASDAGGVTRVDFLVDGVVVGSDASSPYSYAWDTAALGNGTHTVQAKAYDSAGNVGVSSIISVTTQNTTVIINDNTIGTAANQWQYAGSGWAYYADGGSKYLGDDHSSSQAGDTATLKFNGTQAAFYGVKSPQAGIVGISVDGGAETMVDLFSATRADNLLLFTTPALVAGDHTLKVRLTGNKNALAIAAAAAVDRAVVTFKPAAVGDVNADGRVNALDLSALITHDGQNYPVADFNKDGTVGAADLAILLSKWTW